MTIFLNGATVEARDAATIAELVDRYQLAPETLLIEHNGFALHKREWPLRKLNQGDRVELVRVVAGG